MWVLWSYSESIIESRPECDMDWSGSPWNLSDKHLPGQPNCQMFNILFAVMWPGRVLLSCSGTKEHFISFDAIRPGLNSRLWFVPWIQSTVIQSSFELVLVLLLIRSNHIYYQPWPCLQDRHQNTLSSPWWWPDTGTVSFGAGFTLILWCVSDLSGMDWTGLDWTGLSRMLCIAPGASRQPKASTTLRLYGYDDLSWGHNETSWCSEATRHSIPRNYFSAFRTT